MTFVQKYTNLLLEIRHFSGLGYDFIGLQKIFPLIYTKLLHFSMLFNFYNAYYYFFSNLRTMHTEYVKFVKHLKHKPRSQENSCSSTL